MEKLVEKPIYCILSQIRVTYEREPVPRQCWGATQGGKGKQTVRNRTERTKKVRTANANRGGKRPKGEERKRRTKVP
jgi:hypothetical protein